MLQNQAGAHTHGKYPTERPIMNCSCFVGYYYCYTGDLASNRTEIKVDQIHFTVTIIIYLADFTPEFGCIAALGATCEPRADS